jgi:hypothetical protein
VLDLTRLEHLKFRNGTINDPLTFSGSFYLTPRLPSSMVSLRRLTGAFLLSACRDAVVEEAEPQGMLDSWATHPHTWVYALPLLMVRSGTLSSMILTV